MYFNNIILKILLFITYIFFILWLYFIPKLNLNIKLHAIFMFTGFYLLFFEAFIIYQNDLYTDDLQTKIYIHLTLNILAFISGLIGILFLLLDKNKKHLYSLHSNIGLLTFILYSIQFCLGYFANQKKNDQLLYPKIYKFHKFFGKFIFVLICCVLISGIQNLISILINLLTKNKNKYIFIGNSLSILLFINIFFEILEYYPNLFT